MPFADNTSLTDAHIVVIGGSAGIGLATAAAAKAKGARLTLVGRTMARLQAAADDIGGADVVVADIGQRSQVESVFAGISRVDHLVITAGGLQVGLVTQTDPDYLLLSLSERIAGPLYAVKAALPAMSPESSIVLTGGQYSDRPAGNGAAVVSAAVRGIEALARALVLELKPIRVNVIAPGLVDTGLFDVFDPDVRTAIFQGAANTLPVGRVGTARDVADAIIFLLSNGYMSGEVLHIDGGGRLV